MIDYYFNFQAKYSTVGIINFCWQIFNLEIFSLKIGGDWIASSKMGIDARNEVAFDLYVIAACVMRCCCLSRGVAAGELRWTWHHTLPEDVPKSHADLMSWQGYKEGRSRHWSLTLPYIDSKLVVRRLAWISHVFPVPMLHPQWGGRSIFDSACCPLHFFHPATPPVLSIANWTWLLGRVSWGYVGATFVRIVYRAIKWNESFHRDCD